MDRDPALISDQTLVKSALADRNAYAQIIVKFEPMLRRYVRRQLFSHGQFIDDVLQNVFMKAYVNLNDYDFSRPLAPWLYRIAHNEAISYLRKIKSGPQMVAGEDAQLFLNQLVEPDDPYTCLIRNRTALELQTAVLGLDAKYKDVLVLRYLEGKTYDEISDILELPSGTVATLISRGLKRLRDLLKDQGAHDE
jgi:RNA polymerase sigma-70 factor, ECF subfamily